MGETGTGGYVFMSGMFRSGTTLLGTMLNAHPALAIALDPFLPVFKAFRSQVAGGLPGGSPQAEIAAPLDDYYFLPHKQIVMDAVRTASLDLPIAPASVAELEAQLAAYAAEYAPRLSTRLAGLGGKTYAQALAHGVGSILDLYGGPECRLAGFKQAWTDEFAPHVLAAHPGNKVIHIIRDPRATCASKNVSEEKYPWLFLIRQWRKSASFIWRNVFGPGADPGRVMLVRYEDLIAEPEREARRICSFLGVGFDPRVVRPEGFTDSEGRPWVQNTSYQDAARQVFNTGSIGKWRNILKPPEIELIERLCAAEMRAFGYAPGISGDTRLPDAMVWDPPEVPAGSMAKWIRKYLRVDPDGRLQEMALERWRGDALAGGASAAGFPPPLKRLFALDTAFFDALAGKASWNGPDGSGAA